MQETETQRMPGRCCSGSSIQQGMQQVIAGDYLEGQQRTAAAAAALTCRHKQILATAKQIQNSQQFATHPKHTHPSTATWHRLPVQSVAP
jgi:hypothetical protein